MTKPTKWPQRPAKTQISPVWSESLLSAWGKLGSLATYRAHGEDSDQTGRMPRLLIWVFAGRTVILLVLSWGVSFCPQIKTMWFYHSAMCPKNADGMANNVDTDQTAPEQVLHCLPRSVCLITEPRHEKTCLWGLRPSKTQTGLRSHRDYLEAWNFGYRRKRYYTM